MVGPPLPFFQVARNAVGMVAVPSSTSKPGAQQRHVVFGRAVLAPRRLVEVQIWLWVCDSQGALPFTQSSAVLFAGVSAALRGDMQSSPAMFGPMLSPERHRRLWIGIAVLDHHEPGCIELPRRIRPRARSATPTAARCPRSIRACVGIGHDDVAVQLGALRQRMEVRDLRVLRARGR